MQLFSEDASMFLIYFAQENLKKTASKVAHNRLCFPAIFELMSDTLTTIYVEPDQCPSHHAILLTQ